MKKLLSFLVMLCVAIGAWAEGKATVSDDETTVTFSGYSAGEIAKISSWDSYKSNKKIVFTNSSLNSDDVTALVNAQLSATYYNLYSAKVDDAVLQTFASSIQNANSGLILPKDCGITDATIEAAPFTSMPFVVRFSGTTAYYSTTSAANLNTAMAATYMYLSGITQLTTNANGSTTQASALQKYSGTNSTIKKMVTKNGTISGDLEFTSNTVDSLTLSNVKINGCYKLINCPDLVDLELINGTYIQDSLVVRGCKSLDNLDLKACAIGPTASFTTLDNMTVTTYKNGHVAINDNPALRYIILPHNYQSKTGVNIEKGNTNLYAIIATAYTSEFVYDETGNKLKVANGWQDSTRYMTDADGNLMITANYNIYKGNIPDDMMKIAQSVPYYQCTIHCLSADNEAVQSTTTTTTGPDGKQYVALTESDIEGMNGFNTQIFDISRTFYTDPKNVYASNEYVKYVILPDNMDYVLVNYYNPSYPTFEKRVSGCSQLVGAVSYCGDPDKGNCNSDSIQQVKGIMTYTRFPGHVAELLNINWHLWEDVVTENRFFIRDSIKNVVMVGLLNAADICDGALWNYVNSNGNYVGAGNTDYLVKKNSEYESTSPSQLKCGLMGYVYNSNGASQWDSRQSMQNIKRLDLTRAVFPVQNDMRIAQMTNIVGAGKGHDVTLYLPISAKMDSIPDSCLWVGNGTTVKEICIPGNVQHIGDYAFFSNGGDELLHIYTTAIDSEGNGYPARESDAEKYDASKIVDMWDDEEHSMENMGESSTKGGCYTFSSNLKSIGTKVFCSEQIKDVYSMATTAPKCKFNAFGGVSYFCNNSGPAAGSTTVSRNDFHTDNGWMTFLHYPENAADSEKAKYADQTRKFSIPDTDGLTDGNGEIVHWPTQAEYNRSEAQACAGITWEFWYDGNDGEKQENGAGVYCGDWRCSATSGLLGFSGVETDVPGTWMAGQDATKNAASTWQGNDLLYKYYGYKLDYATGNSSNSARRRVKGSASSTPNTSATYYEWVDTDHLDATYDTDYMGWHQFVLAYTSMPVEETYDAYYAKDWYTICVPTDLTKAEVLELFGVPGKYDATIDGKSDKAGTDVYPEIRTLYGVDRNMKTQKITFQFTEDLTKGKTWDFTAGSYYKDQEKDHYKDAADDNSVIMYAGCPYIIKPYVPVAIDTMANYTYKPGLWAITCKSGDLKDEIGNGTYISCPRLDYKVHAIRTSEDGQTTDTEYVQGSTDKSDEDVYYYHFVGTYEKTAMPQYCFFLSNSKKVPTKKWYKNSKTTRNWNPTIAIMGALGTLKDSTEVVSFSGGKGAGGTTVHYITYEDVIEDNLFDLSSSANIAPSYMMAFGHDDDEVVITGIKEVATAEEETIEENAPVYNISGQKVGNSFNGLSNGIYIKNGKKYVVQ